MAQVTIKINGHGHTVGCKDGEEDHLLAMAEQVEQRVEKAKALGVPSGEAKLLVMAALLMADELHDLNLELQAARKAKPAPPTERAKADKMARLAARAEAIAASVEQH